MTMLEASMMLCATRNSSNCTSKRRRCGARAAAPAAPAARRVSIAPSADSGGASSYGMNVVHHHDPNEAPVTKYRVISYVLTACKASTWS